MEKIIEGENIRFSYDGTEVLKGIDISIARGKMVGLLGANGAGKSTLLKILSGIINIKSGRLFYKGKELKGLDRREIAKKIAYVPQSPAFGFPFSVAEIVLMGRSPYVGRFEFERESDWKIALDAMETVGIAHLKERLVTEISGGERQLVSLARALAQEPEIMILDEPATFLDLKHKTEAMKLLNKLKEEKNISVIAATHDIFSGLFYFDQVLMLKDGRIFASGECEEILKEDVLTAVYGIEVRVRKEDGKIFVLPAE
ncbi:MAG TPA: ABC transporter ATP-binding protein [Thermodesulfobacteriota bacterium]|nr:ABC transporter ATP-binding protein [Thermodesulfobacteriota bacterium]